VSIGVSSLHVKHYLQQPFGGGNDTGSDLYFFYVSKAQ